MTQAIPFNDLGAQRRRLGARIDFAMQRVVEHGHFILGPEVTALESELQTFCGANHAVTCANGTDALLLILMAESVGPGDAVFMPSFTFVATAEAVAQRGATPYFVDVDYESFNIETSGMDAAVADARQRGLTPRAIMAVDLFGAPADYDRLRAVTDRHDMLLIADAAQSFGGRYHNRMVGRLADYTTTSFFPAKPLGCYGDGGAIFTDSTARAELLRSLRFHGKGKDKYDNIRLGLNSRLDTLQAAILLEKLGIFADELDARDAAAARYDTLLAPLAPQVKTPVLAHGLRSSWAQYTLRSSRRTALLAACSEAGIPASIYYPIPLHRQTAYSHYPVQAGGAPVSEQLAGEVFSLPMHAYLRTEDQERIADILQTGLRREI